MTDDEKVLIFTPLQQHKYFANLIFMDDKTYYLLTFIAGGVIILAGLGVTIFGIAKRKKLLIALGVFISLIPTMIAYISK